MRDTSPDAERIVLQARRRMPPVERMRQALEWSESARALALGRLRARYPEKSTLELVENMLGQQLIPANRR
jgi:hypothetical protein